MKNQSTRLSYRDFTKSKLGTYIHIGISITSIVFFGTLLNLMLSSGKQTESIGFGVLIGLSTINLLSGILRLVRKKTVN